MTSPETVAENVLDEVPDGFEAEVVVSEGASSLTRFANSFIHQNVSEESTTISLTLVSDGRVSTSSGTVTDRDLPAFVRHAAEAAAAAPINPDWPGLTPPTEVTPSRSIPESTASATPQDRARLVSEFVDAGDGMRAAGYCQTGVSQVVFANSLGHRASGTTAAAILDGIHQTDTSAGSGHSSSRDLSDLDAGSVGRLAADRAARSEVTTDIEPGEYEVVLAPEATATLALFLAVYGFNGKAVNEGQSFVTVGQQQFDPAFELVDDATDPRAMRLTFDAEGTPKRRLELVTDGVSRNVVFDRREAGRAGTESTGHATSFYGANIGPIASDLYLSAGGLAPESLIAGVERGLYVSTFNYVRILDPRTTVATGLTRNGTFLIEDGRITGAVSNLRFTQSFAGAVAPGGVLAVGDDARFADSEFGPGFVHAPSLRLASWRFTGGASG